MNTRVAAIAGTLLVGLSLFVTSIISNNLNNSYLTTSSEAQVVLGVPACTDDRAIRRYIEFSLKTGPQNGCGQGRYYYCEGNKEYSREMKCADGRTMPREIPGEGEGEGCYCRSISEWVQKYKEFCCSGSTATPDPSRATSTPSPTAANTNTPGAPGTTLSPTPICLQQNNVCGGTAGSVNCCSGLRCEQGNPRLCKPVPTGELIAIPITGLVRLPTAYPTIRLPAGGCLTTRCSSANPCGAGMTCKNISNTDPCDSPFADCRCVRQSEGCSAIIDPNERAKCYCIDKSFCSSEERKKGCDGTKDSCPMYYACKPNPDFCRTPLPIPGVPGAVVNCADTAVFCKYYPQFCGCVDNASCPRFPTGSGGQLGEIIRDENPSLFDFIIRSSNQTLRNLIGQ